MRVRVAQASLFLAAQPDPKLTSSVLATRAQACLRSLVICVAGLAIFYAHRWIDPTKCPWSHRGRTLLDVEECHFRSPASMSPKSLFGANLG
jgi:hypothetical protein